MRSPELRTQPRPEPRDHRSDQQQEGNRVRITLLWQWYSWLIRLQTPRSSCIYSSLCQPPQPKRGTACAQRTTAAQSSDVHRLTLIQLLDICVKNCGYPFHLQISTKEFLNELVRRFPERPPVHSSRVQNKILELIEEWRQTICQTSRYKNDLGFIRDMHRLLSYKGYIFPEIRKEDAAVLNPSDVCLARTGHSEGILTSCRT
jgi:hypothetical protein